MRKILKTLKTFVLALVLTGIFAAAGFAWNPSQEVLRLNKEVPSFDTLGNPPAVVWLKNQEMKLNADGTTNTFRYLIVNFGERIPASWRVYRAVVPADGSLSLEHAGIYNPMTGSLDKKLNFKTETLPGGMQVVEAEITDDARGRAVVIVENEKRVNQKGIDATVMLAGNLPVWEQRIAVQMPKDDPLKWYANKMKDPDIINGKNEKIYFWSLTNQPAWHGEGIRIFQRPYISFSSSSTLLPVLENMQKKAEEYARVEKPAAAPSDAGRLMRWLEAPERNEAKLPKNFLRPTERLPKEGPWTPAERTLLLNGWMKNDGGRKIWWQSPTTIAAYNPVAEDFWSSPVIVSASGKKTLYYQAGQGVDYGDVSPFLAGTDIYRRSDKKPAAADTDNAKQTKKKKAKKDASDGVDTKEVKAGSPSDHKLSLSWSLRLTDGGVAEGTLTANIDGAWAGIFSGGAVPTKENAAQLLNRCINFAIPGMVLTAADVKPRPSGYRLDFKVRCAPGIVQGKNMLLKLPGGIPEILGQLLYDNDSITFRFPFTISQSVRMSTPKGYKCFTNDFSNVIGTKKTAYLVEKIHNNYARNTLEADCVWIVKRLKQEMDDAQVLKQQIGAFLGWPNLNLPFRK